MLILAIDPGATSIKMAVFQDKQELSRNIVRFDTRTLQSFATEEEQREYRLGAVLAFLEREGYNSTDLDCVVSRGGPLKEISCGAYRIND